MVQGNNVQKEFCDFVEKCVMGDGNLLTTTNNLFTDANIKTARDFLRAIKPLFDDKNEEAGKANKQANKKVAKTWGIGDIFDGSVFGDDFEKLVGDKKDLGDYKNALDKCKEGKNIIIEILLHCNWLMYLCSDRQHRQKQAWGYYEESKEIDAYFSTKTWWAIGPTFSGTSLDAMLFILELILVVRNNKGGLQTEEDYIKKIEALCNEASWKNELKWTEKNTTESQQTKEIKQEQGEDTDKKNLISTDAIVNIILFFCDTTKYLPIPAQNKKELISKKLKDLKATNLPDEYNNMSDIDQDLFLIREKLRELKGDNGSGLYLEANPFWRASIRPFWDDSTENLDKDQLSDKTLLEYKKAMILYGPPGTSKSYQARKMAEGMIAEALRIQEENISAAIAKLPTTLNSHIHILQMHPNYTYDDFIIGKSIEGNKIVVKPGKMLQIIKGIEQDDKIPHFVILDEINRVDISRVFGELFTAMEASYRDKGVELSVNFRDIPMKERYGLHFVDGKLYLKVPENMYFIGTMNMIDFSLEQVDFALRRRFLWILSTYDPNRLDEIISEKIAKILEEDKTGEIGVLRKIPDDFSKTCTDLNNEIEWENSLDKSYLIGHAFFSEIVDIVKQVKYWDKAKNILWQVSILPTLEAYCGTMDANMQETFLNNCKKAFIPEPIEEKKKKK